MFDGKKVFSFPKSLHSVKDIIEIFTEIEGDDIVLDFFAGSGTTGEAVLRLTKESNSKLKFILCTNNEGGIMTKVCYPRLEKCITGYKNTKGETIEGINANLRYYKTDFVDGQPTDENKKKLVDKSTEMLCLKENCFKEVKKSEENT